MLFYFLSWIFSHLPSGPIVGVLGAIVGLRTLGEILNNILEAREKRKLQKKKTETQAHKFAPWPEEDEKPVASHSIKIKPFRKINP